MPAKTQLSVSTLLAALTPQPQSASALARALKVSRATVHRKIAALQEEGLAVKEGHGPQAGYRLKSLNEVQQQKGAQDRVVLEIDRKTADNVQRALEFYARMVAGQFEELLSLARFELLRDAQGQLTPVQDIEDCEPLVRALKHQLLKLPANAHLGVFSPHLHPSAKAAWTVSSAIRHRLAWDRTPQGGLGVAHDEPLPQEDLPHLQVLSGELPRLPVDLSRLPPGYLLQLHAGLYRVLGPGQTGELSVLAQSRSPQTALQMAVNLAAGRPARSHDLR